MPDQRSVLPSMKDVPDEAWDRLTRKKIYFGHMSVGYNIVTGIEDFLNKNNIRKLRIVETRNIADFDSPIFVHSKIGMNHDPLSKINDFYSLIEKGVGELVSIAFFKFCFVDINSETDILQIFKEYKTAMEELKRKYPQIVFMHMTVPLTRVQSGAKAFIKKIIGRPIDGYEDNIKRNAFNDMLRKEYEGREPIFDLAIFESTLPDGTRATFTKGGKEYPYLSPEYTKDGGHLNEKGRKLVGEQLLILLAKLADQ